MSEFTPAFPVRTPDDRDGYYTQYYGMSLRDYFAGAALTAALSRSETHGTAKDYAEAAYTYADAMLQEREKRNV